MGNPFSRCCLNTEQVEQRTNDDTRNKRTERAGSRASRNRNTSRDSRNRNTSRDSRNRNTSRDSRNRNTETVTDTGRRRRSSRNKNGGTTIVSSKVSIGSCKISIGKNAENITINHNGKNDLETTANSIARCTGPNNREERKDVFTSKYTKEAAAKLTQRTFESISPGNFIDNSNIRLKEFAYVLQEQAKYSHSVCQIRFPGGTGTGFRVGSRCIMTANHVVTAIRVSSFPRIGSHNHRNVDALQDGNVYCAFDYIRRNEPENEIKFNFKAVIYRNEETDTAVLELADKSDGTPMPPPFELFGLPDLTGRFTLMGHEGNIMECDAVEKIIDREHRQTREDIEWVKQHSSTKTSETYEFPPHSTLTNENRILFHCKFSKGASGSPGIIALENGGVVVVTMLLCGYPNWKYGENVDIQLRAEWPEEYCIEQGADMAKVAEFMQRENQQLYEDIFCRDQLPRPAL